MKISRIIQRIQNDTFTITEFDSEHGVCTSGGSLIAASGSSLVIHTPKSTTLILGETLIIL